MKWLLAAAALLAAGCKGPDPDKLDLTNGELDNIRPKVESHIVPGSDSSKGVAWLQANGFSCSGVVGGDFGTVQHADFELCQAITSAGIIKNRTWRVAIVHDYGKVKQVLVEADLPR